MLSRVLTGTDPIVTTPQLLIVSAKSLARRGVLEILGLLLATLIALLALVLGAANNLLLTTPLQGWTQEVSTRNRRILTTILSTYTTVGTVPRTPPTLRLSPPPLPIRALTNLRRPLPRRTSRLSNVAQLIALVLGILLIFRVGLRFVALGESLVALARLVIALRRLGIGIGAVVGRIVGVGTIGLGIAFRLLLKIGLLANTLVTLPSYSFTLP